jgi:hypothetical protein
MLSVAFLHTPVDQPTGAALARQFCRRAGTAGQAGGARSEYRQGGKAHVPVPEPQRLL